MKERPILFSTEMVQAILDGRKTETRRVITPQPEKLGDVLNSDPYERSGGTLIWKPNKEQDWKSPYGKEGDFLYVRENWKPYSWNQDGDNWTLQYQDGDTVNVGHLYQDKDWEKERDFYIKLTDLLLDKKCPMTENGELFKEPHKVLPWRPNIHLPKLGSRIWLRVKEVTVERVQDITTEGIKAEGVLSGLDVPQSAFQPDTLKSAWFDLWNSINKDRGYGWDKNPWVWCVSFEVVSTNGKPEVVNG